MLSTGHAQPGPDNLCTTHGSSRAMKNHTVIRAFEMQVSGYFGLQNKSLRLALWGGALLAWIFKNSFQHIINFVDKKTPLTLLFAGVIYTDG